MSKLSRNDACWCGSGLKYKKCHMDRDSKLIELERKGYVVPKISMLKSKEQIEGIRKSGEITKGALDLVQEKIKAGITTEDINKWVHEYIISKGGIPATLNYQGFPKSVCTSINNEICHGIPDEKIVLKDGDIINVDVTTILDGYYGDASRTFIIGEAKAEAKKLVEVARECLYKGLDQIKPFKTLGDVGHAVQVHAESNGYSVVRAFGGHGIGLKFHEDPFVPHVGEPNTDMVLYPGMTFTVEPMINEGDYDCNILSNEWTAVTTDGKLSAQWEHTIVVTEEGYEILAM